MPILDLLLPSVPASSNLSNTCPIRPTLTIPTTLLVYCLHIRSHPTPQSPSTKAYIQSACPSRTTRTLIISFYLGPTRLNSPRLPTITNRPSWQSQLQWTSKIGPPSSDRPSKWPPSVAKPRLNLAPNENPFYRTRRKQPAKRMADQEDPNLLERRPKLAGELQQQWGS